MLSLRLRDASLADPFWGPGFVLTGLAYYIADGRFSARGTLVVGLVAAWGVRLCVHLLRRNLREGEDRRYRAMRKRHGEGFGRRSLVTVFWLQATLLWLISAPVLGAVRSDAPLGLWDAAGVLLYLVGLVVETVADHQLARFRADPASAGRVLDRGLWRFSRHPNYFGESLVWWGLYVVAAAGGAGWTLFAPALLTYLLLRLSGVPLLEEDLRRSRPGYADYVSRTSAFVPWPPGRAPWSRGS